MSDKILKPVKKIQLILILVEENFLRTCIIMEQIVIYLLTLQKLFNSKLNILKL